MLQLEETSKTLFTDMSDSSRVWIYQANRFLTDEEVLLIQTKATDFVAAWESHGSRLVANFAILHQLFLVFSVDESMHGASGCSIDKSVHFVKEIQNLTGINFFDRTIIAYCDADSSIKLTSLPKVQNATENRPISHNSLIFNNLINNLSEFRAKWLVPAVESWLSRFL